MLTKTDIKHILKSIDCNGYTLVCFDSLVLGGENTAIVELTKGDYASGFKLVRALLCDIPTLTKLNMSDTRLHTCELTATKHYTNDKTVFN